MAALLSGFLVFASMAATRNLGPGDDAAPPRPGTVDRHLAAATDRFGISLLKEVSAARPGENLFLSPLSAQVVLTLTANGARGETQAEMLKALGYGGMDLAAINEGNQALLGLLQNPDPDVELSIANAIWYQQGLQVAPEFERVATQQYRAAIQATRFGQPEAAAAINGWVSDQTRGRIPQLVDRTSPDDRMWLVNAVYFKGKWEKPFDPALTRARPFHLVDGSVRNVPFMHQQAVFGYLKEDGITGVRLPYGEGGLSLYAFMPDRWEGFLDKLTPEQYREWVAAMGQREIRLAMPKLKLTDQAELVEPLTALGMQKVFDRSQADLSGLFVGLDQQLYISRVIQKTFLEVNEEGTEAAAATGVGVTVTSLPVDQPPEVVLDRPFLLTIRDDRTGVTLFMGAILKVDGA